MTPELIAVLEQKPPIKNNLTPTFALVLQRLQNNDDLANMIVSRAELGLQRYGTYLQPDNGRCPYIDGLQECLDLMNYMAQASIEVKMKTHDQAELDDIEKIFFDVASMAEFLLGKAMEKRDA